MNATLLESLECLLAMKRHRLSIAVSLRSRAILKRDLQRIQHQIDALISRTP